MKPLLETLEDRLLPDAAAYVNALYRQYLERPAEPAGQAYWVAVLQQQGERAVQTGILMSQEFRTMYSHRWGASWAVQGWPVAIYYAALNRPPDLPGLSWWVARYDAETQALAAAGIHDYTAAAVDIIMQFLATPEAMKEAAEYSLPGYVPGYSTGT